MKNTKRYRQLGGLVGVIVFLISCGAEPPKPEIGIEHVLSLNPKAKALYYTQEAINAQKSNDYTSALSSLDSAVNSGANCPQCLLNYAQGLYQNGKFQDCYIQLSKYKTDNEHSVEIDILEGQLFYDIGAFDQCIPPLTNALKTYPDSLPLLARLAVAQLRTGKYKQALDHLKICKSLKPKSAWQLPYLAECYAGLQLYDSSKYALDIYQDGGYELNNKQLAVWCKSQNEIGLRHMRDTAYHKAMSCFTQVIGANPLNAEAYANRGILNIIYFNRKYEGCLDLGIAIENGSQTAGHLYSTHCSDYSY